MTALDDDGQNGDVGRIDAGNAAGLCQCLGAKLLQFLSALKPNGRAAVIVKPIRNCNRLVLFGPCGGLFFLLDIALVVLADGELFANGDRND